MEERRKVEEIERQIKLEKELITEAKHAERDHLKEFKEKDYAEHVNIKKSIMVYNAQEDRVFMQAVVEKTEKAIEEMRNKEAFKKNIVKEELSHQIVEKKRMSEIERRAKLEEVH